MTDDDGKVVSIGISPRIQSADKCLHLVRIFPRKCWHERFLIDPQKAEVECADCGERLNPMFALEQLARKETKYHEFHARYQDEMQRLKERSRTKCENCGQMTRISHR
jgi:uncharacterized protein YeaO (DUF488 family)